ncbi:uncharacterized protein LOC119405111 [Rhipicephalus sanguineus]|uniref:Uncharacterized protein n=1 Tax=Rhipicephalus sanguineus TaxID=34632 RepID=A0A9D4SNK6_RHISA|nr:uncharacterized protein LOC119405111 [Rhipicephalus sanguineus]KAH7935791.1 hypothetical protein HPB52_013590 [Rhipicephalus sanguineus]
MSSYELPANASEDVLRSKIDEVQGNLHSLNISNCIVAVPALLLSLASGLRNLQTLSCIACPLKASLLLDRLLTSLQNVTQLDFSLVDAMDDAKEELFKIRHLGIVHAGKQTNIRKMYVEVADKHNTQVLLLFLNYCPLLKDLHVHFVHDVSSDLCAATCSSIADHLLNLVIFTVTCEAPSTAQSDPRQPIDLRYCIDLHGNAVFRKSPLAFNCAQLRNVVLSPNSTFPLEPVVLVAVDRPDLGFLIGVPRYNCSQLRSLCVLLYARNLDQAVYPTISTMHSTALRQFFAKLHNLVELNVSSFHFDDSVDFTELLAAPALQRLRALSLPPCGLRPEGAVRRLALRLGDVEDLDIRLNLDGRHKSCRSCDKELTIEPVDASAFRNGSGRLTLSNVPNLVSVNFLPHFKMPHLRFIDDSDVPHFDYRALSMTLSSSKTLRSLVIGMALINFSEMSFEFLLCPAIALERLCLLTKTKLATWKAHLVVEAMARQLPTIFYIHIHYVDVETGSETTVTWIGRHEGEAAGPSSRPSVMQKKPCIMCSTQTFVGLAKPHYRELQ